jgi:hypothetical protein
MPSSHYYQLNEIVDMMFLVNPDKVLDIGTGFGKYGFLAREYLEFWSENGDYSKWVKVIDGIEAFEPYLTPVHKFIYNNLYVGNALDILPGLTSRYDLILMVDVFEHFTYEDGTALLAMCRKQARNILISVPAEMSAQEEVFGNPYETHKYPWKRKDFDGIEDKYFLPNPKSTICLIGEDAVRIGKIIQKRQRRKNIIALLDFFHLKNIIKQLVK